MDDCKALDFTGATLKGIEAENVYAEQWIFNNAIIDNWQGDDNRFHYCQFDGAKISNSVMVEIHNSSLKNTVITNSEFNEFVGNDISGYQETVNFRLVTNSTFSGELNTCEFALDVRDCLFSKGSSFTNCFFYAITRCTISAELSIVALGEVSNTRFNHTTARQTHFNSMSNVQIEGGTFNLVHIGDPISFQNVTISNNAVVTFENLHTFKNWDNISITGSELNGAYINIDTATQIKLYQTTLNNLSFNINNANNITIERSSSQHGIIVRFKNPPQGIQFNDNNFNKLSLEDYNDKRLSDDQRSYQFNRNNLTNSDLLLSNAEFNKNNMSSTTLLTSHSLFVENQALNPTLELFYCRIGANNKLSGDLTLSLSKPVIHWPISMYGVSNARIEYLNNVDMSMLFYPVPLTMKVKASGNWTDVTWLDAPLRGATLAGDMTRVKLSGDGTGLNVEPTEMIYPREPRKAIDCDWNGLNLAAANLSFLAWCTTQSKNGMIGVAKLNSKVRWDGDTTSMNELVCTDGCNQKEELIAAGVVLSSDTKFMDRSKIKFGSLTPCWSTGEIVALSSSIIMCVLCIILAFIAFVHRKRIYAKVSNINFWNSGNNNANAPAAANVNVKTPLLAAVGRDALGEQNAEDLENAIVEIASPCEGSESSDSALIEQLEDEDGESLSQGSNKSP